MVLEELLVGVFPHLHHRVGVDHQLGAVRGDGVIGRGDLQGVDRAGLDAQVAVDAAAQVELVEPLFGARTGHGWSGTLSLPRVLTLGDDGLLRMDVPEEIEALRYGGVQTGPFVVPTDEETPIDGVAGTSLELQVEMESAEASHFGVKVCTSPDGQEETSVFYDAEERLLKVDTNRSGPEDTPKAVEAAPFELKPGERLKLRVFVDKSVVEVFANSRQAIARRIYPSRQDSTGVRVFSAGGDTRAHSLEAWKITPSNPY